MPGISQQLLRLNLPTQQLDHSPTDPSDQDSAQLLEGAISRLSRPLTLVRARRTALPDVASPIGLALPSDRDGQHPTRLCPDGPLDFSDPRCGLAAEWRREARGHQRSAA